MAVQNFIIYFIILQWTVACIDFAAIPHTEHVCGNSGKENSLLTGKNVQKDLAQCERPSSETDWSYTSTENKKLQDFKELKYRSWCTFYVKEVKSSGGWPIEGVMVPPPKTTHHIILKDKNI
ncbi:hypothetical protein XENOCAPTIV_019801 [Xenoophorus captivus]|uniref:Uncharacterized protein n=1 Tax=Xenoophorus captivus TaxID=1517983 RepID=A0ABV0SBZ4_9TELE